MNEILKQNDIFVSTILNPNASVSDLLANGINATNTGLLSPDVYKQSKFIQDKFKDANGNFDEGKFNTAYLNAFKQFDQMSSIKSYKDLEQIVAKYDLNDVFAPLNSNFTTPTYELKQVKNPYKVSQGVSSLYGQGERTLSDRELAQQHKVFDSTTGKWLDYTADERGLFGGIFGELLVYATYDQDGWYDDPSQGRKVYHRKGDMKTDENGEFYTETAGNRELYGKQFVSIADTLTKEDSWLNKVDFFDSDGLTKSTWGTTFKMAAEIMPYMIPYFNVYYGGFTAAINLLGVMPTFAKMLEGIAPGDYPEFRNKMNIWENYFRGFDESYADDDQNKMWSYAKMATMVSDIFGQLYQMRSFSSLANLKNLSIDKKQASLFKKFSDDFAESYFRAASDPKSKLVGTPEGMIKWWNEMASQMPEIQYLINQQTKLSKSLSLGYMALTSSSDVFEDALAGGYDRRTAGIAALTATAGQYLLMMNNKMGDWFLDATTGYKEDISRNVMKKTMGPMYDMIAEGTKAMAKETSPEVKMNILGKIFNTVYNKGIKNYFNIIKDGGEEFWKKSIIEGTEEVTEEAVMDMTKGVFDFMSWMGWTPNENASFGGWDNVFSEEGLNRYIQNYVGGFVGGALFEFLGKVVEPGMIRKINGQVKPETKYSIIREASLGHIPQMREAIHELCTADNDINAQALEVNGEKVEISNFPNVTTRGQLIEARLNAYLDVVDTIMNLIGAKLTDNQKFSMFLRNEVLIPLIEESEIDKLILSDFNTAVTDVVDAKIKLDEATKDKEEKDLEKEKVSKLKKDYEDKLEIFQDLCQGKSAKKYTSAALLYLHPAIRERVLNLDKYSWTKARYNISYNDKDLPDTGSGLSRETIDKEYKEWQQSEHPEQKFVNIVVPAYDNLLRMISPKAKKYAEKYSDIRTKSIKETLSDVNEVLGESSADGLWRLVVGKLSQNLNKNGQEGATFLDIFKMDPDVISDIVDELLSEHKQYLEKFAEINEITLDEAKAVFAKELSYNLEGYPVLDLDKRSLDNLLYFSNSKLAGSIFKRLKQEAPDHIVTKEAVDTLLTTMGFSPNTAVTTTDEKELFDYFVQTTTPRFAPDTKIDLNATMLMKYLDQNFDIDNEMLVPIKKMLLASILNNLDEIKDAIQEVKFTSEELDPLTMEIKTKLGVLSLSQDDLDLLVQKVRQGLDNNLELEQIIDDYLFNPENGLITDARKTDKTYKVLEANIPDASILIKLKILETIDNSWTKIYENNIKKNIITNPLLDLLREFSFEVSGVKDSNLFQLLENESQYISQLATTDDYIRYGITAEQIDNFIKLLDMFEAVVYGMEQIDEVGFENPIAYNLQMQKIAMKEGELGSYETVDTQTVSAMIYDLELLKNKLQMAQNIIRANSASQVKEDQVTKKVHIDLLLKHLLDNASKLTLKGVSIMPPKDKLDEIKDPEELLAFIEHEIYQNFNKIADKDRTEAITQLFNILGFNRQAILDGGLKSYGLNSKISAISQYDLFVYWATLLSTDQHQFLSKYLDLLNQDWYKHLPKYTQKFAIKIGYSFYNDPNKIHDLFIEELFKGLNKPKLNKTSRIYFLNGISGVGKTSNVAKGLYYMLDASDDAFIIAPNKNQADKLDASITTNIDGRTKTVLDKNQLFDLILTEDTKNKLKESSESPTDKTLIKIAETHDGKKKFVIEVNDKLFIKGFTKKVKLPKVIFIDEATHFNSAELEILNYLAQKNNIKIFTFGDTLLRGALINSIASNIDQITSWNAPRLLSSTRTQNVHSKDNFDVMSTRLIEIEEIVTREGIGSAKSLREIKKSLDKGLNLKYYEIEDELHGHKLVSTITKEDITRIAKAAKKAGKRFGIIANLTGEKLKDTRFENTLKSLGLKEGIDYELYSPEDFSAKAVQGAEAEYFIVKDLGNLTGDILDKFKTVYTFLTRHMQGTIAAIPSSVRNQLNLLNQKILYTDQFILPGSDKSADYKKEEIDKITKILGSYTTPSKETPKPKTESKPKEEAPKPKPIKKEKEKEESSETESDLTEEEKELIIQEEIEGELNQETFNQESIDENPFIKEHTPLWGITAYTHLGLNYDPPTHKYTCPNSGNSLDFDGLLPSTMSVSDSCRRGMIKLQKALSMYPDQTSTEFKESMADDDILTLFYTINPNWAVSEETLPENFKERLDNVYNYLIEQENLKVANTAYVFGKEYDSDQDKAHGYAEFDESKAIRPGEEPLLLFGYRLYTTDKTLNQYISIGSFPKEEKMTSFARSVPNGLKVLDDVRKILETNKFAVLALKGTKVFNPRTQLRIIKTKNPDSYFSLADLMRQGLIIDENHFGLISSDKVDDKFTFLEFKAEFESHGNEELKLKKIDQFYKSPEEGGFVLKFIGEDGLEHEKLICAGNYFVPVQYTQAGNDHFSQILIFSPNDINGFDAVRKTINLFKLRRAKTATETKKENTEIVARAELLSAYSQTKLVLNVLKQIGALTEDGEEVFIEEDGKQVSLTKKYFINAKDQLDLTKLDTTDRGIIQDFLKEDKFDEDSIREFLTQTRIIGIMFIDGNMTLDPADSQILVKDLSVDKDEYLSVDLSKETYKYNFFKEKKRTFKGFDYFGVIFRNRGFAFNNLIIKGHHIQPPLFNLTNDILEEYTLHVKPLLREEIDRSILRVATPKEDHSNLELKDQKAKFEKEKPIVKLSMPDTQYDSKRKPLKEKKGSSYHNNYTHARNKFGWDIISGDIVQLYGNEKTYVVKWVDKDTFKLTLLDPETDKTFTWDHEAVTKVVTRTYKNKPDKDHDPYYKKGFEKVAKEALEKAKTAKTKKEVKAKENKIVPDVTFNTGELDFEDSVYYAVMFTADEDFQLIIEDDSNPMILIETEEELIDLVASINDYEDKAGFTLFKVDKWKNKDKNIRKFDLAEVGKDPRDVIKKKYQKDKDIFGYIQNVILWRDYNTEGKIPGLEELKTEEKTKKKETKKVVSESLYGNKKAEEIADLANSNSTPSFDSIEEARANGFISSLFFYLKQDDGTIQVIPNHKFYSKHGLQSPVHSRLNIGNKLYIRNSLTPTNSEQTWKEYTIAEVTSTGYKLEYNGRVYDDEKTFSEIDALYGSKYSSEADVELKEEEKPIEEFKSLTPPTDPSEALKNERQELTDLLNQLIEELKDEYFYLKNTDINKTRLRKLISLGEAKLKALANLLAMDPILSNDRILILDMILALEDNDEFGIKDIIPESLEDIIAVKLIIEQIKSIKPTDNAILKVVSENGDPIFKWTTEQDCI